MLTFNTDNMVHQRFDAFPAPIMDYILKDLKPEHLLKLYQCCKFFYHKYRLNIIRHLEIVDDGEPEIFDPFKSVICISNPVLAKIKDFWITDSFFYNAPSSSTLIPEFTHCTVKKLVACNFLMWEEYQPLAKNGTIEELKIGHVVDVDDDGNYYFASVGKVISKVPNATSIEFSESIVAAATCSAWKTLDHKAKISNFVFRNITEPADLRLLLEFVIKTADVDCNVHVGFKLIGGESDLHRQLNKELEGMAQDWNVQIVKLLKLEQENKELDFKIAALQNCMAEKM